MAKYTNAAEAQSYIDKLTAVKPFEGVKAGNKNKRLASQLQDAKSFLAGCSEKAELTEDEVS